MPLSWFCIDNYDISNLYLICLNVNVLFCLSQLPRLTWWTRHSKVPRVEFPEEKEARLKHEEGEEIARQKQVDPGNHGNLSH